MKFHRIPDSVRETLLAKAYSLPLNRETFEISFPWENSRCEHYNIEDEDFIAYLFKVLKENWDKNLTNEFLKDLTIKLIIYDIDDEYYLDDHHDCCDQTLIFYLMKDPSIKDDLFFDITPDCKSLTGNLGWEYGLSVFPGNIIHGGTIRGSGLRVLLTIHR